MTGFRLYERFPSLWKVSVSMKGFHLNERFSSQWQVFVSMKGFRLNERFPSQWQVFISIKCFRLNQRFPSQWRVSVSMKGFRLNKYFWLRLTWSWCLDIIHLTADADGSHGLLLHLLLVHLSLPLLLRLRGLITLGNWELRVEYFCTPETGV